MSTNHWLQVRNATHLVKRIVTEQTYKSKLGQLKGNPTIEEARDQALDLCAGDNKEINCIKVLFKDEPVYMITQDALLHDSINTVYDI